MTGQPPNSRPQSEHEPARAAPTIADLREAAAHYTACALLFGKAFRVTRDRGQLVPSALAPHALATVHPSALLRAPDEETRDREIRKFLADLRKVAAIVT
jgi:DNA polymerase